MYVTTIEANTTRTLSFEWLASNVQNHGPGTAIIDGAAVAPGSTGTPVGGAARDLVVTTIDQPARLAVNTVGNHL